MVVDKDTRAGNSKVESMGLPLFVVVPDCYNVVRMVVVVGGELVWGTDMSKVSRRFAVVARKIGRHRQLDVGWPMVGMRQVCRVGEQRRSYCWHR